MTRVLTFLLISLLVPAGTFAQTGTSRAFVCAIYTGPQSAGRVYERLASTPNFATDGILALLVLSKDTQGNVRTARRESTNGQAAAVVKSAASLISGPRGKRRRRATSNT